MWELIKNIDKPGHPQGEPLQKNNVGVPFMGTLNNDEKQALFELAQEEKYKNFNKIVNFRDLILE